MFQDILANTGEFRSENDPNDGIVYFGGDSPRTGQPKFKGASPNEIETACRLVCEYLMLPSQYSPEQCALLFYAEFVAVHPFYDANGRVARFIVNLFLAQHGKIMLWDELKKREGKFLRKINACHSTRFKMLEVLTRYERGIWRIETKPQCQAYWKQTR